MAVRHVRGDVGRRGRRTATWAARDFQLVRPADGRERVELECPVCAAPVLAEVRDHARTRRVRAGWGAACLLALLLCAVSLAGAVHEGNLPAGQSAPALFPLSAAAVSLVLALTAFTARRTHTGVTLLPDGPAPHRTHRIVRARG